MTYTVRYAHLARAMVKVGDKLVRGDVIGFMGTTGQSTALHLHLDVVEGQHPEAYTLADIEEGKPKAAPLRQANYFIDESLFGVAPLVTTYVGDPSYQQLYGKVHHHYDVVPEDRHRTTEHYRILWNRSKVGTVIAIENDPAGYGICVHVVYDT